MCTVLVQCTEESLEAHVELDDDLLPSAGDKVRVYGDPVVVEYGATSEFRRQAELTRGSRLDRLKVRLLSFFELTELYEVSFSTRIIR